MKGQVSWLPLPYQWKVAYLSGPSQESEALRIVEDGADLVIGSFVSYCLGHRRKNSIFLKGHEQYSGVSPGKAYGSFTCGCRLPSSSSSSSWVALHYSSAHWEFVRNELHLIPWSMKLINCYFLLGKSMGRGEAYSGSLLEVNLCHP